MYDGWAKNNFSPPKNETFSLVNYCQKNGKKLGGGYIKIPISREKMQFYQKLSLQSSPKMSRLVRHELLTLYQSKVPWKK